MRYLNPLDNREDRQQTAFKIALVSHAPAGRTEATRFHPLREEALLLVFTLATTPPFAIGQ